ncbi:RHS repeat-associated core domain-containing protein, partial [Methylobacterium indicum]
NDNRGGGGWGPRRTLGRVWGGLALEETPAAAEAMLVCPIRFQGQWADVETGLVYNRFRYYDPLAGQYASSDPTGLYGGAQSSAYVLQPISFVDPLGLKCCPFWTATKNKNSAENAYGHWKKHAPEFPEYRNSLQYVRGAQDFVTNPPGDALTKLRASNGDKLLYSPSSNTFAVIDIKGSLRTMFRPSGGVAYWNMQ